MVCGNPWKAADYPPGLAFPLKIFVNWGNMRVLNLTLGAN